MEGPHVVDPENYKKEATYTPSPAQQYQQSYHPVDSGLEVAPQQQPAYGHYHPHQGQEGPPQTILGLRRTTFFLSLALVAVIIIAAVGGGVGGSLAVQNARNNASSGSTSATKTVTVTVTAGQSPTPSSRSSASASASASATTDGLVVPTAVLALDCPALDDAGEQIITLGDTSWHFKPSCGTDFFGHDIGAVIVYSFHDCMQACAAHNHFWGADQCVVAHFTADMAPLIKSDYGNCWLKNGSQIAGDQGGNLLASAELVSSS